MTGAGDAHQRAVLTQDKVWARRGGMRCRSSSHYKEEDLGPCTMTPQSCGGEMHQLLLGSSLSTNSKA